jgi:hypothetical protein
MKHITLFLFIFCLNISYSQIYFEDLAESFNIQAHTGSYSSTIGNGLSFADYDGDGWDDITLTSASNEPLMFFKNYQGFFVKETLIMPEITYQTRAVNWVDYDNDGDKDLFVTSDTNGNRLYEKNATGLVDVTVQSGIPLDNLYTFGASWGDINNDGCLDFYLSNRIEIGVIANLLFKNNCDGTFTNVTDEVGLTNSPALTFCSGFFDINNDGWQDLYIANDKFFPNILYKNNGDGTFTDISSSSGTNLIVDAMSVTVDDFNNDGFLDIFITNTPNVVSTLSIGSILLQNNGDETFTDVSISSRTQLDSYSWGSSFLDAENDGDLDLYVSCSYTDSSGYPSYAFYENQSDETFSAPNGIGFIGNNEVSYASAIGDVDNDGKVDILVSNGFNTPPFLWQNQSVSTNNYLSISLEGNLSNRDGVGAMLEISVNEEKQFRYIMNGEGYLTQNSLKEFFGIGEAEIVDYIKVKWLSGVEDVIYNITVNQNITIVEGSALSVNDSDYNQFTFSPNPVYEKGIINSKDIIQLIEVYSTGGKKVIDKVCNSNRVEIELGFLDAGIYFIKIYTADKTDYIKVLKH